MEGTYCSRIFSNCDKKRCVLQSPNYPGLYPRNLTCYYAIRQHAIPYGHQALISITQPYSRLVSIKTDRTNPEGADPKPVERKVWISRRAVCPAILPTTFPFDNITTRHYNLIIIVCRRVYDIDINDKPDWLTYMIIF